MNLSRWKAIKFDPIALGVYNSANMSGGELIPFNRDISFTPGKDQIEERERLQTGFKMACSVLDERSKKNNTWTDAADFATSIVRWRNHNKKTGRDTEDIAILSNLAEQICDPYSLAQITTPANFDLSARTVKQLFKTLSVADFGQEEEDLLFALSNKSISSPEFTQKHKSLYKAWESQRPIQLTENVKQEDELVAREFFARPSRYEAKAIAGENMIIFWDNDHLFNQFRYHVTRRYIGGSLDEVRQKEQTVSELRKWLTGKKAKDFVDYGIMLDAVKTYPELWENLCYRVWLTKELSEMQHDALEGIKMATPFMDMLSQKLLPEAKVRFEKGRQIPKLLYLGAESLTLARQVQSVGTDLGAAISGIRDGLTRGEMYSPVFMRIQPEARHRFTIEARFGPTGVWAHEYSYLLTGALLSLDYDFAHKINSGPLEGILHDLTDSFAFLRTDKKKLENLPEFKLRRSRQTEMEVGAGFVVPREIFFHDPVQDLNGEQLMHQLGLRYLVDDQGTFVKIPDLVKQPVKNNRMKLKKGFVTGYYSDIYPSDYSFVKSLAGLIGQLEFWSYWWNYGRENEEGEVWGDKDYPGFHLLEKLGALGLQINPPPIKEVRRHMEFNSNLKQNAAKGIWNA